MGPVRIRRQNDRTYILLDRYLEIAQAAQLHSGLRPALMAGAPLVLNAGRVERIDTAAIQVLVAFCRTARARAIPLQVRAVSAALRNAVTLLGLPAFWEDAASL